MRITVKLTRLTIIILLALIAISTIYPMIFTINASFQTKILWSKNKFALAIPSNFKNYREVFKKVDVPRSFINSVIITIGGVISVVLICTLSAYSATKMHFYGRNILFIFIIASMMIPLQTILYPFYKIMAVLKLINKYEGLIITFITFGIPLTTFQLAAFFKSIPDELIDSANMDGAGLLRIIFQVIFPVSRPVVVTVSLINFVWMWNELLMPLIMINRVKMQPLLLALALLHGQWGMHPTLLSATIIIAVLPVTIVYFIAQKQIIKGMTIGAVKG